MLFDWGGMVCRSTGRKKRGELEAGGLGSWELFDPRMGTHTLYRGGMTMLVHKALLACWKIHCTAGT